jgi:hypothetical protein
LQQVLLDAEFHGGFFFGQGGGGNPHLFVLLSMHGGQMGAIEIRECFILRVFFCGSHGLSICLCLYIFVKNQIVFLENPAADTLNTGSNFSTFRTCASSLIYCEYFYNFFFFSTTGLLGIILISTGNVKGLVGLIFIAAALFQALFVQLVKAR